MKGIEWQSFEDGSLSAEAHEAAKNALSESPTAREELDGLRQFRNALRRQGLAEPVPQARLESMLDGVTVADRRRPHLRLAPVWAVAAVMALLLMVWVPLSMNRNDAPLQASLVSGPNEILVTENPAEARDWAANRSGIALPQVTLAGYGEMKSSRADQGWACYDFMVNGEHVCLTIRADAPELRATQTVNFGGRQFQVGDGIAWELDGLHYSLSGEISDELFELALRVRAECEACPLRKRV